MSFKKTIAMYCNKNFSFTRPQKFALFFNIVLWLCLAVVVAIEYCVNIFSDVNILCTYLIGMSSCLVGLFLFPVYFGDALKDTLNEDGLSHASTVRYTIFCLLVIIFLCGFFSFFYCWQLNLENGILLGLFVVLFVSSLAWSFVGTYIGFIFSPSNHKRFMKKLGRLKTSHKSIKEEFTSALYLIDGNVKISRGYARNLKHDTVYKYRRIILLISSVFLILSIAALLLYRPFSENFKPDTVINGISNDFAGVFTNKPPVTIETSDKQVYIEVYKNGYAKALIAEMIPANDTITIEDKYNYIKILTVSNTRLKVSAGENEIVPVNNDVGICKYIVE